MAGLVDLSGLLNINILLNKQKHYHSVPQTKKWTCFCCWGACLIFFLLEIILLTIDFYAEFGVCYFLTRSLGHGSKQVGPAPPRNPALLCQQHLPSSQMRHFALPQTNAQRIPEGHMKPSLTLLSMYSCPPSHPAESRAKHSTFWHISRISLVWHLHKAALQIISFSWRTSYIAVPESLE